MAEAGVLVFALGVPGFRELVLVAMVALVLYGRAGTRVIRNVGPGRRMPWWVRLLSPTSTRPSAARMGSRPPEPAARSWFPRQSPVFWALVLIAASVAAAWTATRVLVHASASPQAQARSATP